MKNVIGLLPPLMMCLAISTTALAGSKKISCSEMADLESSELVGTIEIVLDGNGKAESIVIDRKAHNGVAKFRVAMNRQNGKMIHEAREGDITGIDEDTKKPIHMWGIPRVETLIAQDSNATVTLKINDHLYGGYPGSWVGYAINGQSFESNGGVRCGGQMMFPHERQLE